MQRLRKRDLVVCVGEILVGSNDKCYADIAMGPNHIKSQIMSLWEEHEEHERERKCLLESDCIEIVQECDLFVTIIKLGYGKGGHDPVSELTTFYSPIKGGDGAVETRSLTQGMVTVDLSHPHLSKYVVESVSRLIPKEFEEMYIRLYCRFKHQAPTAFAMLKLVRSLIYFQLSDSSLMHFISGKTHIVNHPRFCRRNLVDVY